MWNRKDIEDLKLGIELGLSHKEIAEILGKTKNAISLKASRLGMLSSYRPKFTQEEYIKKLPKDIKVLEEYKGIHNKILHKHSCGYIWEVRPHNIVEKHSTCPKCASYGVNPLKKCILYLVYFTHINLYKIGITTTSLKKRLAGFPDYETLMTKSFETTNEAKNEEDKYLKNIEIYKVNTGLLPTGNTETFSYP